MKGLTPPPKQDTASRLAARMLVLIVLLGLAGVAIYTAVTNQRIDLTEDIRTVGLELPNPSVVDGFTVNVAEDPGGPTPVVFLHDVDVAGGLTLAPLSDSLDDHYHGVRIDLPGFGFSDRMPFVGEPHTVAGMADTVAGVLEDRFDSPVLMVGVGLGGEVGAELAYTYPELLRGLVMVDVDFWRGDSLEVTLEKMPWMGRAATYAYETGGQFALDNWSPYCEKGGWCANPDQLAVRSFIITIENTTDSIYAFRRTSKAALAPANLPDITVPVAYVLSLDGPVSDDTVQRIGDRLTDMSVFESDTYQAHLEDFGSVKEAIVSLDS
jgi:pimeloyl-ACP methyl ester carboxylesterase